MDCEKYDHYDKLTPDNRLDVLRDFVNEFADAHEMDRPDVVAGEQPDDPGTERDESQAAAWYDPNTNTIGFHPDFLGEGDGDAALNSAGHELAHAQVNDWFGEEPDFNSDEWHDASEWYADLFADSYTDDLKDQCNDDPPPESPAEPDVPDDEGDDDVEEGGGDDGGAAWRLKPELPDESLPDA